MLYLHFFRIHAVIGYFIVPKINKNYIIHKNKNHQKSHNSHKLTENKNLQKSPISHKLTKFSKINNNPKIAKKSPKSQNSLKITKVA